MARLRCDVSSRSLITAARKSNVIAPTMRKSCTERAFASGDSVENGPRPVIAPQIAKRLTTSSDALNPSGPNRIADHNNNGNGRYNSARSEERRVGKGGRCWGQREDVTKCG